MKTITMNASAINLFIEYSTVQTATITMNASAINLFVEYSTVQTAKFKLLLTLEIE